MKKELKEYYCFNDYIMECPELKGKAAFLKGKKYLFNNQMIAKSELFGEHDLSDEIDFDKHFILQSEWDLLQQKSVEIPKQQLIGMTAFVLEQYKLFIQDKITSEQFRNNVWNYANLLSRQPQLSDFVPCGKDGLPIEYNKTASEIFADDNGHCRVISKEESAYIKALDKVLFKGFFVSANNGNVVITNGSISILFSIRNFIKIIGSNQRITTLESLTPYNLELTDNAKIIINGNV